MKRGLVLAMVSLVTVLLLAPPGARASDEEETVTEATEVFQRILAIPEEGIPQALLRRARGVAIIPGLIKVGLVVGGKFGEGVLLVRREGDDWSLPLLVKVLGGSFGWQIGAQSTDLVLVFSTRRSVEGIAHGTFTVGAEAAVAAGPVGRQADAATDSDFKSEIYAYSRTRGLFAGVSLEGAGVQADLPANAVYYGGEPVTAVDVLEGRVGKAPPAAARLRALVAGAAAKEHPSPQ